MRNALSPAVLLAGFSCLLALPASAQGFEGVVVMKMGATAPGEAAPRVATMWVKGNRMRMEMAGGDQTMTVISTGKETMMLMPKEKKYYVMASPTDVQLKLKPLQLRKLGRSGSYAGYRCEMYAMNREGEKPGEACVTRQLGALGTDLGGASSGILNASDLKTLRAEFGDNFFVLMQTDSDGTPLYEVTKVEKTAVAEERLTAPAGYTALKMPGAPGKP